MFLGKFQMLIQLQLQNLTVSKFKLEFLAIKVWIIRMDDAMVIRANNNYICRVVVLRLCEIVDVVSLHHTITILAPYLFATNFITIVIEFLKQANDATIYLSILHQQLLFLN